MANFRSLGGMVGERYRIYTKDISNLACGTSWVNNVMYYGTVTIDTPENLRGKALQVCYVPFDQYSAIALLGQMTNDDKTVRILLCRPDTGRTLNGTVYLLVSDI